MNKSYYIIIFIFLFFGVAFTTLTTTPSKVKVVSKLNKKEYTSIPEHSSDQEFLLYVKRINNKPFNLIGSKTLIIHTNQESYNKIKVGDILKDLY